MDPDEIRLIANQLEEGGKIVTALQQDTIRIRQELKQSKQETRAAERKALEAERAAERNRLETEAAQRRALEAEKAAERKALEAEQAAQKLAATVLNMLQEGLRIETISKCVDLPQEAIQKLAQQFRQGQTGLT